MQKPAFSAGSFDTLSSLNQLKVKNKNIIA